MPEQPQEHPGSRACYYRGCREEVCIEAARVYAREWARRDTAKDPARRSKMHVDTDALECGCGGLLAEDDDGRIFCLRCDPVAVSA